MGCFWAFFWFCAACALASAVHSIKDATDVNQIVKNLVVCTSKGMTCTAAKAAKFATLTVAIVSLMLYMKVQFYPDMISQVP